MMATARADDELIEAVSFPCGSGAAAPFAKWRAATATLPLSPAPRSPTKSGVRLAVGGVADMPVAREFPRLEGSALDDALNTFAYELDARDDIHATARYRRDLVRADWRDLVREVLQ